MRRYIVAVIGNSDLSEDDERYILARRLGKALIDNNYRVASGGLGGIMEAVSFGARESGKYREGDIIGILPMFDPTHANRFIDIPIATGQNYARNTIIANSDAVIAIGGGAGTLSEMAFAWMMKRLIIAYRVKGWSGKLVDKPIDDRIRYPNITDDRVYGVSDEAEAIHLLERIEEYNRRTMGIKMKGGIK